MSNDIEQSKKQFRNSDTKLVQSKIYKLRNIETNCEHEHALAWREYLLEEMCLLAEDLLVLFEQNRFRSIPIVFRAFFEVEVNLLLLLDDDNRWITLTFLELESLKKFQTDHRLKSIGLKPEAQKNVISQINELKELNKGYTENVSSFENRLKILNSENLYIIYRLLSKYTHPRPHDIGRLPEMVNNCMCLIAPVLTNIIEKY